VEGKKGEIVSEKWKNSFRELKELVMFCSKIQHCVQISLNWKRLHWG
jgi:hypothetical protein